MEQLANMCFIYYSHFILSHGFTPDSLIVGEMIPPHFHLRSIGRNRKLLSFGATAQLIHALISNRILYNF